MKKQFIILSGIISITLLGCNQIKLESKWTDKEITVDGKLNEWTENLVVPKNRHVGIGFMNDENSLYLTLTTMDRNLIMQALTLGFTVWIDPKGGKSQHFGIRYPFGGGMGGLRRMMRDREQYTQDFDFFIQDALLSQNEVEVIGPGKDQIARFGPNNTAGIDVIAMYEEGVFTYEMRVPLQSFAENLYAIDVKPGTTIGVGFTTPEIDRGSMGRKIGRGGGMGGRGGMGGGRGGGGRSGGSMGRQMPESLKYWVKVTLANNPESQN